MVCKMTGVIYGSVVSRAYCILKINLSTVQYNSNYCTVCTNGHNAYHYLA